MYAMNIQNDVIGLVLRENCKSKAVTDFIAWPSRCHDTIFSALSHVFIALNYCIKMSNRLVVYRWCYGLRAHLEWGRSWTKDYKFIIHCFSAKHTTLGRNSKDRLARKQDKVSDWDDMSIRGRLFQWASTIKTNPTKRVDLVQRGSHHICFYLSRTAMLWWISNGSLVSTMKTLK